MSDREESPEVEERNGSVSGGEDEDDAKSAGGNSPRRRSRSPRSRSPSRSASPPRRKHVSSSHRGSSRRSRSRSLTPPSRSRRSPSPRSRRHFGNRDEPEPSRCLGIFGMSLYTSERDLKDIFGEFGRIVYDHPTGRSRGFGFVYFEKTEDAIEAKERISGSEIDGHKVRIDFSITKRPHTPTPGVYMGNPRAARGSGGGGYRGGGGGYRGGDERYYAGGGGYGARRSPSPRYYDDRRGGRRRSRSYDRDRDYY